MSLIDIFKVSEFQKILENIEEFFLNLEGWRFIRCQRTFFEAYLILWLTQNKALSIVGNTLGLKRGCYGKYVL